MLISLVYLCMHVIVYVLIRTVYVLIIAKRIEYIYMKHFQVWCFILQRQVVILTELTFSQLSLGILFVCRPLTLIPVRELWWHKLKLK